MKPQIEGLLYRKPRLNEFAGKIPKCSLHRGMVNNCPPHTHITVLFSSSCSSFFYFRPFYLITSSCIKLVALTEARARDDEQTHLWSFVKKIKMLNDDERCHLTRAWVITKDPGTSRLYKVRMWQAKHPTSPLSYSRTDHSVTVLAFEKCGQKYRIRLKNLRRIVICTSQLSLIRC